MFSRNLRSSPAVSGRDGLDKEGIGTKAAIVQKLGGLGWSLYEVSA